MDEEVDGITVPEYLYAIAAQEDLDATKAPEDLDEEEEETTSENLDEEKVTIPEDLEQEEKTIMPERLLRGRTQREKPISPIIYNKISMASQTAHNWLHPLRSNFSR